MWGVGLEQEEAGMPSSLPFTPLRSVLSATETKTPKNKKTKTTDDDVTPSRVLSQLDRGEESKSKTALCAKG